MTLVKPYISGIAKEFWCLTGHNPTPPHDLFGAVNLLFPINIVSLSGLTIKAMQEWLFERNIKLEINLDDRNLYGFILLFNNTGFIFINGTDPVNERRYTLAHEISHYILEYKIPREKAVEKFGATITEVLDGYREATASERISGVLSSVSIKPFIHLLEKANDGSFVSDNVLKAENDADSLALELLAPVYKVVREVKSKSTNLTFQECKAKCHQVLTEKYGLPDSISVDYSTRLAYNITGGPSLMSKFGF